MTCIPGYSILYGCFIVIL